MPFGEKPDVDGQILDFDEAYEFIIKPAVEERGLDCIRCDKIEKPGCIHAEMIRHIYEDDVAIVDLTTLNANVFYELGVRQALRPSCTVLIRKKGTKSPFNIQGLNAIEYDMNPRAVATAKGKIGAFINAGLKNRKSDSLVHDVLHLRINTQPTILRQTETIRYKLAAVAEKEIGIVTGDIQNIRGMDVWVSSENTNMQMARFFDRSISSVIRYLGAEKDEAGLVTKDTIAEELSKIVGEQKTVPPATIIVTTAGQLEVTHQVKKIFHAAAVSGAVGRGYTQIPNVADCVTNALAMADSPKCTDCALKSILFPLMGTGTARAELEGTVRLLIETAVAYLSANPGSTIQRANFVAWSEEERAACRHVLDDLPTVSAA